jgi:hypothetical protein
VLLDSLAVLSLRTMLKVFLLILLFFGHRDLHCTCEEIHVAHLTIHRRGGAVARREPANLTHLAKLLQDVEKRYSRVKREVKGNKLVRRWRARNTGTTEDEHLLDEPGQEGSW